MDMQRVRHSPNKGGEMSWDKLLSQITSGRFILTVICGVVFAYATIAKIIPPDAVISILTMVFISYFQRTDRKPEENGGVK